MILEDNMRKDESGLIKTLARESEKISTKDNFFSLSSVKEQLDLNVSAWKDHKNLTLNNFGGLPPIHLGPSSLRHTQNESFSKGKLEKSPESPMRLKLSHDRSKSISLTRASVYKPSIISITEDIQKFSSSTQHKPRIPKVRKNAIISMYLPKKRRKRMQNKGNFATIEDLMSILQPTLHNSITKKVISMLRSKADLTRMVSKKNLGRVSHNLSI
jgi:hypothetical protein